MNATIGFSTGKKSLISAIIRKLTGSKVSHAFIIFTDPILDDKVILEADRGGYQLRSLNDFLRHNNLIAEITPIVPIEPGIKVAAKWLGRRYDYLGLFSASIMMLGRWLHKKWNNPFHGHKEMFCSEAVVRLLQAAKYPGTEHMIPWDITPDDLLKFLQLPRTQ